MIYHTLNWVSPEGAGVLSFPLDEEKNYLYSWGTKRAGVPI